MEAGGVVPAMSDDRSHGIEFKGIDPDDLDYPIGTEELLDEHGDATVDLKEGETTLEELLEGYDTEFEDAEELREGVLTMVSDDALDREDYSDRGDESAGGQESDDQSL